MSTDEQERVPTTIRIATRGSQLALAQTSQVAEMIRNAHPGVETELVTISTRGDRTAGPLAAVGGKGLFTRELEDALRAGEVDLAVHSAKDLPAEMEKDFALACVPARQDPRDALASRAGALAELPRGATVGTGSPRRRAQLLAVRPDLNVVGIRGNIETRLGKAVGEGAELDAVVLAMAGLIRGGLAERYADVIHPLDAGQVIPAGGQGVLALQTAAGRCELAGLLGAIEDADSRDALEAERAVVRGLEAGCQSCLAVHVSRTGPEQWLSRAMAARVDGSDMVRIERSAATAARAGVDMLDALLAAGAKELIAG